MVRNTDDAQMCIVKVDNTCVRAATQTVDTRAAAGNSGRRDTVAHTAYKTAYVGLCTNARQASDLALYKVEGQDL